MHSYLIINHTPQIFEVALFTNNNLRCVLSQDKRLASKLLIPMLQTITIENNIPLTELAYIGINQGPGLFSTLRSIIATVNGLHAATHIPLIGVDGLEALLYEYINTDYTYTIALLDACNKDVYYAIAHNGIIVSTGYKNIDIFLNNVLEQYPFEKIHFIGTGTELYKDTIQEKIGSRAFMNNTINQVCSINTIAQIASKKFTSDNQTYTYLLPLYLKKHPVEMQ
jgi:tRNA threonylcarbamoyl adenosine modification protein YeaZ